MNLGPEFSVFGESVPGKMPSTVFEYRFPEKKLCVPGAALPSPEAEEAGADELLTVERAVSYTHLCDRIHEEMERDMALWNYQSNLVPVSYTHLDVYKRQVPQ